MVSACFLPIFSLWGLLGSTILSFREKHIHCAHLLRQIDAQKHNWPTIPLKQPDPDMHHVLFDFASLVSTQYLP